MNRKLASVQRILELSPIPGAEKIELAKVLGWNVVVQKEQYSVNELIVFCEVDSILPRTTWTEFLFKDKLKPNFRLRTVRLRGQISQGIVFPLSILPQEYFSDMAGQVEMEGLYSQIGIDVTTILGITKYEPNIPLNNSQIKSHFPSFLRKTDEERIQTCTFILDEFKGQEFYVTEKIDGKSMTVYLNNGEFGICSRNFDLKIDENVDFFKVARQLDIENKLRKVCKNIAIQGELYGEGIQNNKYGLKGLHFSVYNVFDIDKQEYLSFKDAYEFIFSIGLSWVPVPFGLYTDTLTLNHTVDDLVALSQGASALNPNVIREGIVIRSIVEKEIFRFGRLSFKVINPEFLLKYNE